MTTVHDLKEIEINASCNSRIDLHEIFLPLDLRTTHMLNKTDFHMLNGMHNPDFHMLNDMHNPDFHCLWDSRMLN